MAVPTVLTDLSATAASNSPSGSESVGSSLDDYLRGIQAVLRGNLAHKGADIASAGTTDLGAVVGLQHDITGTTTITGFGTVSAGVWKILKFEGAVPIIHNATSLIIPGGANVTTADGDVAVVTSEGSGNWRVVSYFRSAVAPFEGYATQAQMETGTSTAVAVPPGRQHSHPGHPKCWAFVTVSGGTPTLTSNYNITSVTDTAVGRLAITIATDFSSANWCCIPAVEIQDASGTGGTFSGVKIDPTSLAAGSVLLENWSLILNTGADSDNTLADPVSWHMVGYGDQ